MNKLSFNPKILDKYFSDFVRFLCRSCKRYNTKHTCPPLISSVDDYRELLPSFEFATLIYEKFYVHDCWDWEKQGRESSLIIFNELKAEQLTKPAIAFGAGSCKLCSKCDYECRFPERAIIPIEATGIDVIKLFKDLTNIELKFPVEEWGYYYRIGCLFYD